MADHKYLPRLVDSVLGELVVGLPAVLLVGPRASGKTTTARRHARSVIRLDRPAEAAVVAVDPDVALAGLEEPVLIDEWQVVPDVLGAVKRAVDDDPRPGRFLLTGSVRAELAASGWPATGRTPPASPRWRCPTTRTSECCWGTTRFATGDSTMTPPARRARWRRC